MGHLLTTYSRSTGLRIGRMKLTEHFYPLPEGVTGYILVCAGSGMEGKNYSFFSESLYLLRTRLPRDKGMIIVQIGDSKDPKVGADLDLTGKTSLPQYFWLVKNATLVIANDSSIIHVAGHYDTPHVAIFSVTNPRVSGAYYGSEEKRRYLTPDFPAGTTFSFNPNQSPKPCDSINPEQVAHAAQELLGLDVKLAAKTHHIGEQYLFSALEMIPNHVVDPSSFPNSLLNIRRDLGGDDENVFQQLSLRKCNLIVNRPLDTAILKRLVPNIDTIIYEIDESHNLKFAEQLRNLGAKYLMVSYLSKEKLQEFKLDYHELGLIHWKKRYTIADAPSSIPVDAVTYRTNKFLLSAGKVYGSRAHWRNDIPLDEGGSGPQKIVNSDEFWDEAQFFWIFELEPQTK